MITVTYFALIAADRQALAPGTDAAAARGGPPAPRRPWPSITGRSSTTPSSGCEQAGVHHGGFQLLPRKFTLTQLQRVYEAILGRALDKRNFRRKMELLDILTPLAERAQDGASRPAQLYSFSARQFEKLKDKGILFPF